MLEGRGGGEPGSGEGPCPFGASGRKGSRRRPSFAHDPGFDPLLPTFRQRTIAPIMLPAELPEEPKNVVVEAGLSGEHYGILFLRRPTGNTMERCVHANDAGTLTALPESQETTEYFQTTREETVKLSDGTEVRLRYIEPTMEGGTYDPFWEGSFERQGYTYTARAAGRSFGRRGQASALNHGRGARRRLKSWSKTRRSYADPSPKKRRQALNP